MASCFQGNPTAIPRLFFQSAADFPENRSILKLSSPHLPTFAHLPTMFPSHPQEAIISPHQQPFDETRRRSGVRGRRRRLPRQPGSTGGQSLHGWIRGQHVRGQRLCGGKQDRAQPKSESHGEIAMGNPLEIHQQIVYVLFLGFLSTSQKICEHIWFVKVSFAANLNDNK